MKRNSYFLKLLFVIIFQNIYSMEIFTNAFKEFQVFNFKEKKETIVNYLYENFTLESLMNNKYTLLGIFGVVFLGRVVFKIYKNKQANKKKEEWDELIIALYNILNDLYKEEDKSIKEEGLKIINDFIIYYLPNNYEVTEIRIIKKVKFDIFSEATKNIFNKIQDEDDKKEFLQKITDEIESYSFYQTNLKPLEKTAKSLSDNYNKKQKITYLYYFYFFRIDEIVNPQINKTYFQYNKIDITNNDFNLTKEYIENKNIYSPFNFLLIISDNHSDNKSQEEYINQIEIKFKDLYGKEKLVTNVKAINKFINFSNDLFLKKSKLNIDIEKYSKILKQTKKRQY
jgi:hypothetical protein